MYLVDTNVVSEARRGTPQAVAWLKSVDPMDIHLSVITRSCAASHSRKGATRPRPRI